MSNSVLLWSFLNKIDREYGSIMIDIRISSKALDDETWRWLVLAATCLEGFLKLCFWIRTFLKSITWILNDLESTDRFFVHVFVCIKTLKWLQVPVVRAGHVPTASSKHCQRWRWVKKQISSHMSLWVVSHKDPISAISHLTSSTCNPWKKPFPSYIIYLSFV